jgi:hypothetical protein
MDLDEWYNKVWLGQQDSYVPYEKRGYQATTGNLPSYHTERTRSPSSRASPPRASPPRASPTRRASPPRASPTRRASPTLQRDEMISDVRSYPGSASAGRYTAKEGPFCGPAGGAAVGTFPVKDFEHIRNALSRARTAPTPEGVRKCACARAQSLGLKGHFPSCPMNK